jgi:hypothetical protein
LLVSGKKTHSTSLIVSPGTGKFEFGSTKIVCAAA